MISCVCIGGPMDGTRREFPAEDLRNQRYMLVRDRVRLQAAPTQWEGTFAPTTSVTERYVVLQLAGYFILVHDSLAPIADMQQIVGLLLRGYGRDLSR